MSFEVKTKAKNGMKFVEFTGLDGKRKRISLGTRDPKDAEILARNAYVAHVTGADTKPAPKSTPKADGKFTLGQAFDRMKSDDWAIGICSSWRTVWSDADILLESIGDIPVADVQYEQLKAYVEAAKAKGHAPGTIKKRLSRLRTVLKLCATKWVDPKTRLPYISFVPAFPKAGNVVARKVELSETDERRVYEYCDNQVGESVRGQNWWLFKQFITWQIDTGMRKGETLGKDFADVKGDVVVMYDGETKNDEGREVPLTSRLQAMLKVLHSMGRTSGRIFAGLTVGKVFEMWDEVRTALELGDVTIHDLRHTRGQRLADAGVPIEVIADLLGHKDITITASVYTFRKTATLRKWTEHAEAAGEARAAG